MIYVYLRGRLFSFARAFRIRWPRNISMCVCTSPSPKRNFKTGKQMQTGRVGAHAREAVLSPEPAPLIAKPL